jgi:hypothetical protein
VIEVVDGVGVPGFVLEHPVEVPDGVVDFSVFIAGDTEIVVCLDEFVSHGGEVEDGFVVGDGVGVMFGAEGQVAEVAVGGDGLGVKFEHMLEAAGGFLGPAKFAFAEAEVK